VRGRLGLIEKVGDLLLQTVGAPMGPFQAGEEHYDLGLEPIALEAGLAFFEVNADLEALGVAEDLSVQEEISALKRFSADLFHPPRSPRSSSWFI
jgi:hypothetical protein